MIIIFFWKTVKTSDEQTLCIDNITLIENDAIVSDDKKVSEIFNEFFGNAVSNMDIAPYHPPASLHESITKDDKIPGIIKKYEMHPSVIKIREIFSDISDSFSFGLF